MRRIFKFFDYFFIGFEYLASKKIVAILVVVLFLSLLDTTYAYKEEVLNYEEEIMKNKIENIENKSLEKVKVYDNDNFTINNVTALDEKISCYNKNVTKDELPSNVLTKIDDLNMLFSSNEEHFSFLYKDIETGFTISYNEMGSIFTASSIKAPAMIYLYEEVSKGNINLEEKLTYTSNFYNGGSGVLQYKEFDTEYTVKQLIEYTIINSDNIAYAMLVNRFGRKSIYDFWTKLGTKDIFKYDTIWGYTNSFDASIYMSELYRFYLEDKKYGPELMELFKKAGWKMVANKEQKFNTANKGGWSEKAFHDVAIVFEKNPYILIIMSNTGESDYTTLFTKTNSLVGQIHEEYWKYKESICEKIKQY